MRHVESGKLERWLGTQQVEHISRCMFNPAARWYGPPILVGNIPSGRVYATRDGDFIGSLGAGSFMGLFEYQLERAKRLLRRMARSQGRGGKLLSFADFDALIAAATVGGKNYDFQFQKAGTTGVVGGTNSLWRVAGQPNAASNASNAPGGDATTDATTGAVPYANPTNPDTLHLTTGYGISSVAAMTLLLYDRIFQVNKTMSSTSTESVTGVPTRYQSTTPGAADSAEGNFLFVEIGAALGATAHNWTVCQYTDQAGNTGVSLPSLTGNSSGIINRLDHPVGQWFAPLAANDTGIQKLTQMQCSASVTGTINFVMGHPLMWVPCPVANLLSVMDALNSAFSLTRIFDNAALALLDVLKSSTTATNHNAHISAVAG